MCGIVGYIGDDQAAPFLLSGLEKLEYRGYDSAGVAVYDVIAVASVDRTASRANGNDVIATRTSQRCRGCIRGGQNKTGG